MSKIPEFGKRKRDGRLLAEAEVAKNFAKRQISRRFEI
jgi:hypothetical protein